MRGVVQEAIEEERMRRAPRWAGGNWRVVEVHLARADWDARVEGQYAASPGAWAALPRRSRASWRATPIAAAAIA
jgi:hypothetical protein